MNSDARTVARRARTVALSLLLTLFGAFPAPTQAQPAPQQDQQQDQPSAQQQAPTPTEPLRVAIKPAAPFVMQNDQGEWEGISIELWQQIADQLGLEYEFVDYDHVDSLVQAVAENQADVGVAALTVTADREEVFDFTHPFYSGGLGIAVPSQGGGFSLRSLFGFVTPGMLSAIGGLAALLLGVGLVVWIAERKKNADQFGGTVLHGLGSGFWFSAVTMTTVGYGDKAPVSPLGRFVALIWMFASVIIISFFTGAIASAFTASQLTGLVRGPEDLPRAKVASLAGSATAGTLSDRGVRSSRYDTLEEALDALERGEADAVVHDAPILAYQIATQRADARMLEASFTQQPYAFAVPTKSPLREELNRAILEIIHTQEWNETVDHYLAGG